MRHLITVQILISTGFLLSLAGASAAQDAPWRDASEATSEATAEASAETTGETTAVEGGEASGASPPTQSAPEAGASDAPAGSRLDARAAAAQREAAQAEARLEAARQAMAEAEARAAEARERAEEEAARAADPVVHAAEAARLAEERARAAEERAVRAEQRAEEADARAGQAEERARSARQQAWEAQKRIDPLEERVESLADRLSFGRSGFYVGAGGLLAPENFAAGISADDSRGLFARVGYRFHAHGAIEARYDWLEEFDAAGSVAEGSVRPQLMTLNVRAFPWTGRLQPYFGFGVGIASARVTATRFSDGQRASERLTTGVVRPSAGLDLYVSPTIVLSFDAAYPIPHEELSDFRFGTLSAGVDLRF